MCDSSLKAALLSATVQGGCEKNITTSRFHNTTKMSKIWRNARWKRARFAFAARKLLWNVVYTARAVLWVDL